MSLLVFLGALACGLPPLERLESPADPGPALPLVVAIHGLGDRPESLLAMVEACKLPIRVVAPRGPDPAGDGFSWFDVAFGPDGATFDAEGIARSADRLAALIDDLKHTRTIPGPVVITGFSQGGILSFAVAVRHPETVGTALPLAGGLPEALVLPDRLPAGSPAGHPVIHAFHGGADPLLPVGPTRTLVDHLAAAGYTADLTVFEGVEHTVPQAMHAAMCQAVAEAIRP